MTHTTALCGHLVPAVGEPGSEARRKCESEFCPDCIDAVLGVKDVTRETPDNDALAGMMAAELLYQLDPYLGVWANPLAAKKYVEARDVTKAAFLRVFEMAKGELFDRGEMWSWIRNVLGHGAAIQQDYAAGNLGGYEMYSARLDAAARERADELAARCRENAMRILEEKRSEGR